MATATTELMTAEQFAAWAAAQPDDGRRYELDRGRVVVMPPPGGRHGALCRIVGLILGRYALEVGRGYACTNDTGLVLRRDPDTLRGADLLFFVESQRLDDVPIGHVQRLPELVIEVRSPSDRDGQVLRKVQQYLAAGVQLVWIIDPDEREVFVHRRDDFLRVLDESDTLTGNGILPGFSCPVADLFRLPGTPPSTHESPPRGTP